jgi:hypothetical protein
MRKIVIALAVVAMAASVANATFWLQEDFESGTNGWTMNSGTWTTETVDAQHGLSWKSPDGLTTRATKGFDSGTADVIIMTAEWYQVAAPGTAGRAWVGMQQATGGVPAVNNAMMRLGTNNLATYQAHIQDSTTKTFDTGITLNSGAGAWHELMIKVTMSTKVIEWTFDGATGSYTSAGLLRPNAVVIGYNYSNGSAGDPDSSILVDKITVGDVVPEPATLALLGVGGLLFVRRRRTA